MGRYTGKKALGHTWIKKGRKIDIFAYNVYDPHNGPKCSVCGYGFCHHCQDGPSIPCPGAVKAEETTTNNTKVEICSNNIYDYCIEGGFCGKKPSIKCFEGRKVSSVT